MGILVLHHDCRHSDLQVLIKDPAIKDLIHTGDIHLLHLRDVGENLANLRRRTPVVGLADHLLVEGDVLVIIELLVFGKDVDDHRHFFGVKCVLPKSLYENKEFLAGLHSQLIEQQADLPLHPLNRIQRHDRPDGYLFREVPREFTLFVTGRLETLVDDVGDQL